MPTVPDVFLAKYGPCPVKGCRLPAEEQHHILYDYHPGGPFIKRLCSEHHAWITRAHNHAKNKQKHSLSPKQRWYFWYKLVKGEMRRPRRTHLDVEWETNWDAQASPRAADDAGSHGLTKGNPVRSNINPTRSRRKVQRKGSKKPRRRTPHNK
jgi:hypothetical protein